MRCIGAMATDADSVAAANAVADARGGSETDRVFTFAIAWSALKRPILDSR